MIENAQQEAAEAPARSVRPFPRPRLQKLDEELLRRVLSVLWRQSAHCQPRLHRAPIRGAQIRKRIAPPAITVQGRIREHRPAGGGKTHAAVLLAASRPMPSCDFAAARIQAPWIQSVPDAAAESARVQQPAAADGEPSVRMPVQKHRILTVCSSGTARDHRSVTFQRQKRRAGLVAPVQSMRSSDA